MKFFRKATRITVRISPDTIVPPIESNGFFMINPPLSYRLERLS
jgi:hypothetical protein